MLGFYFKTIIFWVIINFIVLVVCAGNIISNGWIGSKYDKHYTPLKALLIFVCTCAIPVLRVVFLIAILMMANITPDEYDMIKDIH